MQRGAAAPRSLARPVTVAGRGLRAPGAGEGTAPRPALRQPGRSRLLPAQPRGAARGQGSCPHPKTRLLGLVCSQPPVPALGRALPTATLSRRPGSPSAGAPGAGCGDLGPGHPRRWWGRAGPGLPEPMRGAGCARACGVPPGRPAGSLPDALLGPSRAPCWVRGTAWGPGRTAGHMRAWRSRALRPPPSLAFSSTLTHAFDF